MSANNQCESEARQIAYVGERSFPVPQNKVKVGLIRALAGIPADHVLVRDHNSPNDPAFVDDEAQLLMSDGNVFKVVPRCEITDAQMACCSAPPKFAISMDDAIELVVTPELAPGTLRDLFQVGRDRKLYRDFEAPNDECLDGEQLIDIREGMVFISKKCCEASLEIATPKGVFTSAFPFATKLSEVVAAVVAKFGLGGGDVFELVKEGEVLQPKDGSLQSFGIGCSAKLELVATGSGV